METRYTTALTLYPYARVAAQDRIDRHPVVIVGGGPIGLGMALDLAQRDIPALVLDDHEGPGAGSKAICFSKRALDICHRLDAADAMVEKGVVWNVGKVFSKQGKLFEFNLLPEAGHRNPAFINLQQPYFEQFLFDAFKRAQDKGAALEIRGRNRVTNLTDHGDFHRLDIETPDGPYQIDADWVIACDGAKSPVRDMLGLGFDGRVFEDNFLIADVKMKADFPTERWFWFEPPFGEAQSALLHKQPDDIWRIDFQLGWDIDRKKELDPDRIRARVDSMLSSQTGVVPEYELDWTSIYTFQCRRMKKFRHGRVIFAGDAAHQVSPFGARGANSGMQDVDNLGWKLGLVIAGKAPKTLLDTYDEERIHGADENILNSTRSTDFITPKSKVSKAFRNAVLTLAEHHAFARPMVNSGRLSVPCTYDGLSLNGPDALEGPAQTRVGSACPDTPLGDGFLLDRLPGGFTLLTIDADAPEELEAAGQDVARLALSTTDDPTGALAERYLGDTTQAVYLIRPDQHVAARWPTYDAKAVTDAMKTACGMR